MGGEFGRLDSVEQGDARSSLTRFFAAVCWSGAARDSGTDSRHVFGTRDTNDALPSHHLNGVMPSLSALCHQPAIVLYGSVVR